MPAIFSSQKSPQSESERLSPSLLRIIGLLLEGCALHAVPFDTDEHHTFRDAIRDIGQRFEHTTDSHELLILAGEANKTIQSYGASLEKYLRTLTKEKHLAIKLLTDSLLRVCNTSEESAQALRHLEGELNQTSQVEDMRVLRAKLASVVEELCREAERQEQQHRELKTRVSECASDHGGPHDQVTGLPTLRHAEARIADLASAGHQAHVIAFFLKNVEVVNRRFGFDTGDKVLRSFAAHLAKHLQQGDQLFRWRGPCFVAIIERMASLESLRVEADRIGTRGPEQEVEGQGKSMVFRLSAATTVFAVKKADELGDLSVKIDRFAADQFKEGPPPR